MLQSLEWLHSVDCSRIRHPSHNSSRQAINVTFFHRGLDFTPRGPGSHGVRRICDGKCASPAWHIDRDMYQDMTTSFHQSFRDPNDGREAMVRVGKWCKYLQSPQSSHLDHQPPKINNAFARASMAPVLESDNGRTGQA